VNVDKTAFRQQFRSLRECLPTGEVSTASVALCHRLAAWLHRYYRSPSKLDNRKAVQPTNHVLTYLAFRNEPDLSLLFELLPHIRWTIPRIVKGRRLSIHPYDPERLVRHRFGMLEPAPGSPLVDPGVLDIALVPGVADDWGSGVDTTTAPWRPRRLCAQALLSMPAWPTTSLAVNTTSAWIGW
jgi:5-formyltetrahydrofolate cyclo-ligase